jgi:hypothetical protein
MINYPQILSVNYVGSLWSMDGNDYSTLEWFSDTQKPTQAELDALATNTDNTLAKNACKKEASELLYATDWTTIPDVANTSNNPYLTNQTEFIAYRNVIRGLAVNPVANPTFPTEPQAVWS